MQLNPNWFQINTTDSFYQMLAKMMCVTMPLLAQWILTYFLILSQQRVGWTAIYPSPETLSQAPKCSCWQFEFWTAAIHLGLIPVRGPSGYALSKYDLLRHQLIPFYIWGYPLLLIVKRTWNLCPVALEEAK
jgi:hypothetical protein